MSAGQAHSAAPSFGCETRHGGLGRAKPVRHIDRPHRSTEVPAATHRWPAATVRGLGSQGPKQRAGRRGGPSLRDPSYDRFLSVLFPEMAAALTKPGGKRRLDATPAYGDWQAAKRAGVPTRRRAAFLEKSPRVSGGEQHYPDPRLSDLWPRGRELEAWKRGNPDWVREWFANNKRAAESDT